LEARRRVSAEKCVCLSEYYTALY